MSKVVVITGASSGVGKALAFQLAEKNYKVYATMRNPKPLDNAPENLIVSQLDVTDDNSVSTFLQRNSLERVDILVNNAGYSINGTHEQNSIEQAKQQFETNFFGILRMHSIILPLMRNQRSGHIIAVSSVGGVFGCPFNDLYCTSKFAVEGLYESLASTNKQLGIHTSLIEPGPILTEFVNNAQLPEEGSVPSDLLPVYQAYRKVIMAAFENNPNAQTGDDVAKVIVQAIEDGEKGVPNLRYPTSESAKMRILAKLQDTTGNTQVNNASKIFFSQLNSQ